MPGIATKLVVLGFVFCILTWLFVLGEAEPGRVYELAYVVVSAIVVGWLIHWFWPDSMWGYDWRVGSADARSADG